jgi:hypothetical protein
VDGYYGPTLLGHIRRNTIDGKYYNQRSSRELPHGQGRRPLTFKNNKTMAAKSKHYLDVLSWVKSVIKSIDNPLQDETAKKLIGNYFTMYGDKFTFKEKVDIGMDLRMELDAVVYKKRKQSI